MLVIIAALPAVRLLLIGWVQCRLGVPNRDVVAWAKKAVNDYPDDFVIRVIRAFRGNDKPPKDEPPGIERASPK